LVDVQENQRKEGNDDDTEATSEEEEEEEEDDNLSVRLYLSLLFNFQLFFACKISLDYIVIIL
jgi:hypothetical protein